MNREWNHRLHPPRHSLAVTAVLMRARIFFSAKPSEFDVER
jgi:hypothetical protein